jgi:hypothetical protein
MEPKYSIEIKMLPKNCVAFKEGSVATFSHDKTFGDCSSGGSPIKDNSKEYMLKWFRDIITDWKGYEHILERELKTNELPSKKNMIVKISPQYKNITEQDIWDELDKMNNGFFQSKLGV